MGAPVGQLMVGGLAIGCAYALIAVAFSLVYRTSRTINFAQGDMAMLGAYIAFAGGGLLDHRVLGIIAGIVAIAALAVVIDVVGFRPLYRHGSVFVVASSIALVFVLEDGMQLIWGSQTISAPALVEGRAHLLGLTLTYQQLLIVGVTIVFLVALQRLFRSRVGVAMRMSAENPDVARLMGVSPRQMVTASFALAGATTAIGGVLVAPLTQLRPGAGGIIGLSAVVAAIVGGFGSIPGAVLGGLFIGLVEEWTSYLVGGSYSQIATFTILILVLLIRPTGLLGEEGLSVRR